MSDANRYDGKPMLRLMDSYVLDAIGVLDEQTAATLQQQAPTLADALGVTAGSWQSVVEQAMHLPEDSPQALVRTWATHQSRVQRDGATPDPLEFAHRTVDRMVADET